jgi:dTMP kinase
MPPPGFFIAIEGPEGAGKSTLLAWLSSRLSAEGVQAVTARQPGGTPVAEAARKLVLSARHDLAPQTELLLFLAARADLVARVIQPALDAGNVVLVDRFNLSTRAYQVAGRGLASELVEPAIRLATGGLEPDLTLVLDIPLAVGRDRLKKAKKAPDRMERADDAFHERVRRGFQSAAGTGIVHLDATQPKQAVQAAAWREVATRSRETLALRAGS